MSFPKIEGYVVTEKLGSGSYSTVYKANTKVGAKSIVAIKCVDKSRVKHSGSAVDNLIREIRLLKSLTHPHIVHMKHFEWDDKNIYIIMEYCCGGDLSRYIHKYGRVPERQVLYFLQQLASALKFLREKGVVHMDLKPHNLLLHKGSDGKYILKVGDFGFAQYMSEESMSSVRGSPLYMAPEMLAGEYGAAVDLWSVGIIMYECLFGRAPYSSNTLKELIDKVQGRAPIEIPRNTCISAGCLDLLTRLLQHDPKKRITYEEFFNHEYLDLEHMPSKENYEKAVSLIKQAIELDSSCRQQEAFEAYKDSLLYLVPVVNCESDALRRSALTAKLTRYMERAEEIKHNLKCNSDSMPSISMQAMAGRGSTGRPTCCVTGNSSTNSYDFSQIQTDEIKCTVCQSRDGNVECACEIERDINIPERENREDRSKQSANVKPVTRSPSRFGLKRLFGKSVPYLDNKDSSIADESSESDKKTQNAENEGCRIT